MFRRRWRKNRQAMELVRLLVALDAAAAANRPWEPQRTARASLGNGRL
jgi:hypothetical protein